MATSEEQAIAAINAAEQMAIANVQLIRQLKGLIPAPFDSLADIAVQTNTAGIRTVANIERSGVSGVAKKKRKVSKYSKQFGKELKKLKVQKPRTPITRLMKTAHSRTKKAMKKKK